MTVTNLTNVQELIDKLEPTPPVVYGKCMYTVLNKKGKKEEKRCVVNLCTGQVYKNRKLDSCEMPNDTIVRQRFNPRQNQKGIVNWSFKEAQIVNDKIVLVLWVFADGVNEPETSQLNIMYYGNTNIDGAKKIPKTDPNALFAIALSTPKIGAIVTIDGDKNIEIWSDIHHYGFTASETYYSPHCTTFLSDALVGALMSNREALSVNNLLECFRKFFKIGYIGANKYTLFKETRDVPTFMKATALQVKETSKQKYVDKLTSYELPQHTWPDFNINVVCYADRVNDDWTVLRWYHNINRTSFLETSRMYVSKTEHFNCRFNLKDAWVFAGAKLKAETFYADELILQSPDVFDGTKLEYFKDISSELSNRTAALYMLMTYPEFEKMYKIGLNWLCDKYLTAPWQTSWYNFLDTYVGHVDKSAKNIMKFLGINRYQLDKINEAYARILKEATKKNAHRYYRLDNLIAMVKYAFNAHSINHIDNETFDTVVDAISFKRMFNNSFFGALHLTYQMYDSEAIYFIKDLIKVDDAYGGESITYATQWGYNTQGNVIAIYYDTLRMIESCDTSDVLRPRFSSAEELLGHHNVMTDLSNAIKLEDEAKRNARYESAFQKGHKKWSKWEWNEDVQFCVIAPVSPIDLAQEGIALRHCVKSYIPNVAHGETSIMFIRRKGSEDIPFFTVEVDNENRIRQVHGACNCVARSVIGLTEFVTKWAKRNKLKYHAESANRALAP